MQFIFILVFIGTSLCYELERRMSEACTSMKGRHFACNEMCGARLHEFLNYFTLFLA
jgi:hypothetical protein